MGTLKLGVRNGYTGVAHQAWLLSGVTTATSLTKLFFKTFAWVDGASGANCNGVVTEVAACASLSDLTGLRDLTISDKARLVPGDALALTTLTNLARLKLESTGSAVDDVAAIALACSLTQLRIFDLRLCALGGLVCLASIAHLSQLTELRLDGADGMTRRGVMLLTKLTQLQQLTSTRNDEVTQEWMDQEFWVALRQR